ncbi:LEM domain protein [Dictyocaulus viviparus]|uniref:LEM domain protein n=1 Tax=Dictyocaulus viviparus TaxID=29172 RepID=A0A0D8YAC0_DICVI|nr:LEM domain protein [Dictyocaulus viviparus]
MDLNDMTDSDIRRQLIAMGQDVGPVTPSTRAVHLKKLRNLLAEGDRPILEPIPMPSLSNGNGVHLLDIVNVESTAEVERSTTENFSNDVVLENLEAPKAPLIRPITPPAVDDGSDEEMRGEESMRYLSAEEMELEMNYSRKNTTLCESNNSNLNKILLVAVLMTIIVFLFFLSDRLHRQTDGSTAEEEL